ncbi:MAG: hypothetical protein ACC653_01880 [Gammaproteobacteria bacterium]
MSKFRFLYRVKLLFSIIFIFILVSCTKVTGEQQINFQIVTMQQALTDKSLSDFMQFFTRDFVGNEKLSKAELQQLIYFHFIRNRNIETYKWQADIIVKEQRADVELYVVVSGSNSNIPERGRVFTIKSSWIKIKDSWMINKASWEDAITN